MKVQELFCRANFDRVVDAYILMFPPFRDYDRIPIKEKLARLGRLKQAIRDNCDSFRACVPSLKNESYTIFILELESGLWEDKGKPEFWNFAVRDEELREKAGRNFDQWRNEGEDRLERYGIDMTPMNVLASYEVAGESVSRYGIEACCAVIFFELFWFGYTDEQRAEGIEALKKELDESMEEFERDGKDSGIPAEEFFDQMFEEILNDCENEDERQYMILEREFHHSVEDINRRFGKKVSEHNDQI
ncbi:MAG: hypothetical protein LUE87_12020, partial [Lachnospiraceae bacterium]|nr:hypothetical protein [Lachnospiraceae bacterium]